MFKVSTTCCRGNQALLFQWLWVFLLNDHYAQFKRSSLKTVTKYLCQSQTVAITSNVKHVLYNANMCFEVSPGVINFNHHCICAFVDKICWLQNFTLLLHLMTYSVRWNKFLCYFHTENINQSCYRSKHNNVWSRF